MFKRIAVPVLIASLGFSFAQSADGAIIIIGGAFDGTDVGQLDTFLAETNSLLVPDVCTKSGSSPEAEKCWADHVTGKDLVFDDSKTGNVQTYSTNTENVIAFQLAFGPGYYIIKNASWWALIENNVSINWGVIDLTWFGSGLNLKDGVIISHVSEFNPGTPVPEPGSLALIGLGLVGFGLARRKLVAR